MGENNTVGRNVPSLLMCIADMIVRDYNVHAMMCKLLSGYGTMSNDGLGPHFLIMIITRIRPTERSLKPEVRACGAIDKKYKKI